ncbi:MAG: hypothetical protein ACRENZ_06800 [Thermodesulfobacteriota bacterium]
MIKLLLTVRLFPTVICMFALLSISQAVWGHGVAGKRFFPTTISIEDPFVADELSFIFSFLKESGEGDEPPVDSYELEGEYTKRITQHFGITFADEFRILDLEGEDTEVGFGNLEVGAKYQFLTNARHEAVASIGVNVEIQDTGNREVEAEPFTIISPALFFGKGLGDLPESLKYLRPLAITGVIGLNFPTDNETVTTDVDELTGEIESEVERNPNTFSYGFVIQYNLQYLESLVKDVNLSAPLDRMILLVEFPFETCLDRGCEGDTTGFVNPGIIWFGKYLQLGIEAQIPINNRSGENVGVLAILHFFIDDLFPNSLGRPIFR